MFSATFSLAVATKRVIRPAPGEGFNHPDPEMFSWALSVRREGLVDAAVSDASQPAEECRTCRQEGEGKQTNGSELQRDGSEKREECGCGHENRVYEQHQALPHGLAHGWDVVGGVGHKVACLVVVEIARGKLLKVREELVPEAKVGLPRGAVDEDAPEEAARGDGAGQAEEKEDVTLQPCRRQLAVSQRVGDVGEQAGNDELKHVHCQQTQHPQGVPPEVLA